MASSPIAAAVSYTAGKLWKLIPRLNSDGFSGPEIAAIQRLVSSHRELRPGDTKEEGLKACSGFLETLAVASKVLGVPAAPRQYRSSFTANYRAIFPDSSRNYRVDVLEGCLDQPAFIWVNGDQFELSHDTLASAEELRSAWTVLGALLDRWALGSNMPTRQEMAEAFQSFDYAWAGLEHKYINELIRIEGKARSMVVEAMDIERKLAGLEEKTSASGNVDRILVEEEQTLLVQSIGRLNSVANYKRKGRDDLSAEILRAALAIKSRQQIAHKAVDAAQILAADVVESFEVVRNYLRQVGSCLECLDPHLCNNTGLVSRLADWEESWEVGQRYITNAPLLSTLCDLVAFIQQAQVLEPRLASMCEDCDVELFLVLPRLVMLRFLIAPEKQMELLKELLPHRFQCHDASMDSQCPWHCPALAQFAASFQRARLSQQFVGSRCSPATAASAATNADVVSCEAFIRAAVLGFEASPARLAHAESTVAFEDFMRELEHWSIEVQRHCAEDWNQCSAVLVRCLSESVGSQKQRRQVQFDI